MLIEDAVNEAFVSATGSTGYQALNGGVRAKADLEVGVRLRFRV